MSTVPEKLQAIAASLLSCDVSADENLQLFKKGAQGLDANSMEAKRYWESGFRLFKKYSQSRHELHNPDKLAPAVQCLCELATSGESLWGESLRWKLIVVEALAEVWRHQGSECYFPSAPWAEATPQNGAHPTCPQPKGVIDTRKTSNVHGLVFDALDELLSMSCSRHEAGCSKLDPGCEPLALHRHPDVLLCMRAVRWHESQRGKQLLAWSLMECYDRKLWADDDFQALKKVEHNQACMMVLDDEALTSLCQAEEVGERIDSYVAQQGNVEEIIVVVVVIGRVLLRKVLSYEWKGSSRLNAHFFGFQRWPVPKHYASLASWSREGTLSFTSMVQTMSLSICFLQLELIPPRQLTTPLVVAINKVARIMYPDLKGLFEDSDVHGIEQLILEASMMVKLDTSPRDTPPWLQQLVNRVRLLQSAEVPAAVASRSNPNRQGLDCVLQALEAQQLEPLLEVTQLPLRPSGLQAKRRDYNLEQDRDVLESITDKQQPEPGWELQLGSKRGHQLYGIVLRCEGLSCVHLVHCRLTGHGSLCSLVLAASCLLLKFVSCHLEGGGRGLELQCVTRTELYDSAITGCSFEGIRCPSLEETMLFLPEVIDCKDLMADCALELEDCELSLLPGGAIAMCHGVLTMRKCRVRVCGLLPSIAAVTMHGEMVFGRLTNCSIKGCPYAGVALCGFFCSASIVQTTIESCGLGIVMKYCPEDSPFLGEEVLKAKKDLLSSVLLPDTVMQMREARDQHSEKAIKSLEEAKTVLELVHCRMENFCGPAVVVERFGWFHLINTHMRNSSRQPRYPWDGRCLDILTKGNGFYWSQSSTFIVQDNILLDILEADSALACCHSPLPAIVASAPFSMRGSMLLPHLLLKSPIAQMQVRQARLDAAYAETLQELLVKVVVEKYCPSQNVEDAASLAMASTHTGRGDSGQCSGGNDDTYMECASGDNSLPSSDDYQSQLDPSAPALAGSELLDMLAAGRVSQDPLQEWWNAHGQDSALQAEQMFAGDLGHKDMREEQMQQQTGWEVPDQMPILEHDHDASRSLLEIEHNSPIEALQNPAVPQNFDLTHIMRLLARRQYAPAARDDH